MTLIYFFLEGRSLDISWIEGFLAIPNTERRNGRSMVDQCPREGVGVIV